MTAEKLDSGMAEADAGAVDALAAAYFRRGTQPGIAYGIVLGGRLAHAGGFGQRRTGGPAPDSGTVFRIASMTKSFTASAILALRDDGALALDDPAERYVPELRDWAPVTPDAGQIRIRHLLTMTAGFPTDDPWGDRQQGLPLPEFDAFLAGGVRAAWAPGTRFEYSNLGYAILGRVITAVTGQPYPDHMRARLLEPLGLTSTCYEAGDADPDALASGYRRAGGQWSLIEPDPTGAFAPMGGIFSSVRDLATWVTGFASAFPPGGEDEPAGTGHPVGRATRREMQLPQVGMPHPAAAPLPGPAAANSYGFGLFVDDDPRWGRIVHHSGGYPGFGSNMRWHPATGTGVIVLGNATYAPVTSLATRLLPTVLAQQAQATRGARPANGLAARPATTVAPSPVPLSPGGPWPETLAARDTVIRLLGSWDDATADALFSANVAQDEPYPERRHKIGLVRDRLGGLAPWPGRAPEHDTPAHCRWWVTGEHGVTQVEIKLSPQLPPRVQLLSVVVPPADGSPLRRWIDRLLTLLNDGATEWPPELPAGPGVDTALLVRRLRMAGAWAGLCHPGPYRYGDGETTTSLDLDGEFARLRLTVTISRADEVLQGAEILTTSLPGR